MDDEDSNGICEGCLKSICAGMKYMHTTDGCDLCEECAPTWSDIKEHWASFDPSTDNEDESEGRSNAAREYDAHLAAGGSPDEKPLSIWK